jgi:4-diphosphocytidyl-2C-methyl-D-erythritol kinase
MEQWLVLLVPRHELSGKTAALFRALEPADFSDGAATAHLARRLSSATPLADADLFNAFEAPARRTFVGLDALWCSAESFAARPLHLSGAGPALFALARDDADATALADQLGALGERVFVATFVQPSRSQASEDGHRGGC